MDWLSFDTQYIKLLTIKCFVVVVVMVVVLKFYKKKARPKLFGRAFYFF